MRSLSEDIEGGRVKGKDEIFQGRILFSLETIWKEKRQWQIDVRYGFFGFCYERGIANLESKE